MNITPFRNLSLSGIIVICLSACGSNDKKIAAPTGGQARQQEVTGVDAYIVKTEAFGENIEVPGSIIANETTEIHPEVSGRITQLNIAEGRYVQKGALLAKLYDADMQAQLKKLQVQLEIAKTNEERSGQLLKIQGISQADYDASLLNVNNIRADMDIIHTNITRTEIRAPFSGKVGLRNISPGAYVTPSTIIAVINQTDQLKLDFTVPEKYTVNIKTGQIVYFTFQGSDSRYSAKISATESAVSENTRSLKVRSVIQEKDDKLLPGAFAKVQLRFAPDPNTILIPSQAVIPQARVKKVITYNNGIALFKEVTTGVRDSARIQVTEGLVPGDTVVLTGLLSIRPEGQLKINRIVN